MNNIWIDRQVDIDLKIYVSGIIPSTCLGLVNSKSTQS